ncbi:AMP-binding protein [Ottowia thiooxydans]|uniref:AMP-binding protein n=1 Tax=Ottowia thiooxydans TaxID=219182 RepID=UPI00048A8C78|nr:AMP-binding protein [Ottowia thiooxydans]
MNRLNLSHDVGTTDTPLIEIPIGQHFEMMAARFPEREALVSRHQGVRLTYAELDREANRLASALIRADLRKGDRVGIWAHNSSEWLLMQIATAKAGIVLVNINPAYRVTELEYALNKVGCKMLVTMTAYKTSDYLAIVNELTPELASALPGQLSAAKAPLLKTVVQLGQTPVPGMLSFADLLSTGDPADPGIAKVGATLDANEPINIQFTSGTTGFPKGATLTHRNILNNGFFIGECMKLTEHDRLCIPVPLYHCFGMVLGNLACLTHGATIVYPNDGFDPLTVLETVQEEKCTGLHGVPTMFIAELAHPRFKEFDLSSLRTGIMAGSPCPIEVMKQVVELMHMDEVTIAYGMTETSPVSCQSTTQTPLEKRVSTVGLVQPHLEIKVIDPANGSIVAPGETGELCTKGYSVTQGYWGDAEKTNEAIDADGWMHTGDLATMDAQGYVNIVGRIKDMVIRGGENIYPREIEEFLYKHPAISDAQVIGVPDSKYGEELCAWIILKSGQQATTEEIRAFCQGKIAHYKVPRYIRFVDSFPMTITGKIQKFVMRDLTKHELNLQENRTA